jgi:GNAT superfamily N-acetyltransferase
VAPMDRASVLAAYDRECRAIQAPDHVCEWAGPVFRMTGKSAHDYDNGVLAVRLDERTADAAIAEQVEHFSALGKAFEWKLHDHDVPADLGARLARAGFVAAPVEMLVALPTADDFVHRAPPEGVEVVRLDDPEEYGEIVAVHGGAKGDAEHAEWLAESLRSEARADPGALSVYVARARGVPVSAGWVRLPTGRSFASLWGGSTLPEFQRLGIYTNLVAHRIAEARERGFPWITVDCSDQSLPLLERRGFRRLAVITPWIWRP